MDQPIQVTGTAGRNLLIRNSRLLVQLDNLIFSVFVAVVTGVIRVRAAVTGGADTFTLSAVIQREVMSLQSCRQPGFSRGVAHLAAQAHKTGMDFRFLVTGGTDNLAILKWLSHVAVSADQRSMFTGELKYCGMIKIRHAVHPVMAIGACAAK